MDDSALIKQFEDTTLPMELWDHRQHVKTAYLYLLRHPFDEAIDKMRSGLQAYNAVHGVPDEITRGYHETLTQAWMRLVHVTLQLYGRCDTADVFVDANSQLLSKRALLLFYSRDRILSAEAKRDFIPPDLAPLPKVN